MTLDIGGGYENRNHSVVVGRPMAAVVPPAQHKNGGHGPPYEGMAFVGRPVAAIGEWAISV